MRWLDSHSHDVDRSAEWLVKVLGGIGLTVFTRYLQKLLANKAEERLARENIIRSDLGEHKTLRGLVEDMAQRVETNAKLREEHAQVTDERFSEIREDLREMRREFSSSIEDLRREAENRESNRQEQLNHIFGLMKSLISTRKR